MTLRLAAILTLLMAPAAAFPAAGGDMGGVIPPGLRTIEVDGSGEARAKPDTALLSIAIETRAATAEQCASLNAALADKVSDALKSKLDGKGKIETGNYSLYPEYNERPGRPKPSIVGYRAENSLMVETRETDLVGPLIDTAIAAGANQINFLNFTLRDDSKARAEAIAKASKDAQAQANTLATSLGVRLKRIYRATTAAEFRPMPMMVRAQVSAMAANAPTPVEPGEVVVPARISLVYEIE